MKTSLVCLALIWLTPQAWAESKMQLRFDDIKGLIETRNERVLAKSSEAKAAALREGSLERSFFPTAELHVAQESFKKGPFPSLTQPTYGAEVSVNLFNGGRDAIENEKRSFTTQRKRFETTQTLADEVAKAREAYWRSLYLRDVVALLKEARISSSESSRAAERRIRSGVGTETDRVEFEMTDFELKREIERAELEQKNQMRILTILLGLEAETVIELKDQLVHQHDWEALIQHTESDHAFLVKPSELRAREAEAEGRMRRRSWLPRVDAYAAYNQFNQREEEDYPRASDRQESVIGVRLSMNLFEGLANQRESSALAAEATAADAEARYLRKEIDAHLHGEIAELKLLHDQVHSAEENVKRAEKYFRLTQSEYGRGVKNSPDVVGALEKLTTLRQRRLEIVRDFQIAKSHVLAKVGK